MKKRAIIFSAFALCLLILIFFLTYSFNQKVGYSNTLEIDIPKNTSLNGIIEIFNSKGLLEPGWLYKITARIYSIINKRTIQAGFYSFKNDLTNYQLLEELFSSKNLNIVKVTIPEGTTIAEIAEILYRKADVDKYEFMRLAYSDSLLLGRGIYAESVEGYLMPNTYFLYKKQSASEVIDKLLVEQNKIWIKTQAVKDIELSFSDIAKSIGMSRHEVLTLASIIEAETPVTDERARVSGVYHNRLESGWNLQADPTVQYGLGIKSKLSRRDLSLKNEYNTYINKGLPPGPINNPGISSIEAALKPEKHDYMYFVAIGDGSGRHNFSRTLKQHNSFRKEYRRKIK